MYPGILGRLTRSLFLAVLAVASIALSSCGDSEYYSEENEGNDEMANLDPWRMWGNTQTFEVPQTMTGVASVVSGQLVKVAYGRPETWSFFFSARLVETLNVADSGVAVVNFDVTQGVGRSHLTIQNFESFRFEWPGTPTAFPAGKTKYSTSVVAPDRDDSSTTSIPVDIDQLVAQDIQIQVGIYTGGLDYLNNVLKIEVSAFIAPKTHIRPEWFERIGKFRGGEDNGS
jgi:hypothetical protein